MWTKHTTSLTHAAGRLSLVLALALVLIGAGAAAQAAPSGGFAPSLGVAENFAILGGTTVTNSGPTIVTGDLGVSPGTAITGFPPGIVFGTIFAGGDTAAQAQADASEAYNELVGLTCNTILTGQDLGGLTLAPGIYCFSSTAQLTGKLTLDGQNDPNATWVFQVGTGLNSALGASVEVINADSASACNVFWQVGSSATLGADNTFIGNILAQVSISLGSGTDVSGRALAQAGVTLESNTITACALPAAVTLAGFTAQPRDTSILVQWETASEQNNAGFHLYRGTDAEGPGMLLNEALIAAQAPGSTEGFSYEWRDAAVQADTTYYYWLEAVDLNGDTERFGPVSATVEAPTAVTVSSVGASTTPLMGWQWAALGMAALGVVLCWRWKPQA
jgi:hypothetical protein